MSEPANPSAGRADEDDDADGDHSMGCGDLEGDKKDVQAIEALAQQIMASTTGSSYASVVKKRKGVCVNAGGFVPGSKKSSSGIKETTLEVNILEDALLNLCKHCNPLVDGDKHIDSPVELIELSSWLEESMRTGICVFFMARNITGMQVRSWVRSLSGGEDPVQIIFLGKNSFYVRCRDYKQKFALLSKSAGWGGNLFGIPLPWEESFDPCAQFAAKCPVWVLVKNIPIFILPHLEEVLSPLGKVLYLPKMGAYVHSRSAKVCILWDLDKEIPGYLKIPVKDKEAIRIQLVFEPFPLACFHCNGMGHYAKVCPLKVTPCLDVIVDSNANSGHEVRNLQTDSELKTGITEMDITQVKERQFSREATGFANAIASVLESNPFSLLANDCPMAGTSQDDKPPTTTKSSTKQTTAGKSQRNKKKKAKKKKKSEDENKEKNHSEGINLYVELSSEAENSGESEVKGEDAKEEEDKQNKEEDNTIESEPEEISGTQQTLCESTSRQNDTESDKKMDKKDPSVRHKGSCFQEFLREDNKKYYIPVDVHEENEQFFILYGKRKWCIEDFFTDNYLDPRDVVFVTKRGNFRYNGSVT